MESKHVRTLTYFSISIIGVLAIVYFFWLRPNQQLNDAKATLTAKEFIELKSNIRSGLAQALAGAALLIGLGFTWRNIRATERNLNIAQENIRANQETAAKNLTIALEGQITERFTKAIELLSNDDSIAARLGAIYALERIAKDSERDQWTIVEILTAYIREKAHWDRSQVVAIPETADEAVKAIRQVPTDLEACLNVISRRVRNRNNKDQRLNLMRVDLRRCKLRNAHLENLDIGHSRLEWSILDGAHLEGAFLYRSHLERAVLRETHFEGADLGKAHFENAWLIDTHFNGSDLKQAHFDKAVFLRTHFESANLSTATGLTQEQINRSIVDEHTLLPDGLVMPEPDKD
jgi:uncharacterized protein YjbI with pentapeptide repeats